MLYVTLYKGDLGNHCKTITLPNDYEEHANLSKHNRLPFWKAKGENIIVNFLLAMYSI